MLIKTGKCETDARCWLQIDEAPVQSVDAILAERQQTHGEFRSHAAISQSLKASMRLVNEGKGWDALTAQQAEALEMIAHKIARILNGNPNYPDHWADIARYATLVQRGVEGGQ